MPNAAASAETTPARAPLFEAGARTGTAVLLVSPGLDAASRAAARADPPPVVVDGDAARCALLRGELSPAVPVVHADPAALPFAGGTFSVVVVGAAARIAPAALGELARVLAPDGDLVGLRHALARGHHAMTLRMCAPRTTTPGDGSTSSYATSE